MTDQLVLTDFTPFDPAFAEDPYPAFTALREQSPVHHVDKLGWLVSRYDDVVAVCRDPGLWSSRSGPSSVPDSDRIKEIRQTGYPKVDTLLTCDPPEHKRYRSLVGNAFSTRRVAAIEDRIATVADELIDRFVGAGSVELVHQFAIPLPLTIIAEQLGVPVTDLHLFKEWSDAAVQPLGGLLSEEEREACAYKYAEMQHYFAARVAERRDDPQDDMLTDMVAARLDGERPLDVPELLSICAQFLVAGNETTTKLISACAQLLCQHPDQLAAVRDDPSLVPGAVEESLRMESAVQTMFRTATRDTELAGVAIPEGGRVVLLIGAANRDPATFPDPDRFDVRRPNARFNLGFAHGEHYCIGAALARAEATIGVRALLTRLPGLRFGAGNTFLHEPSWTHRGLKELHLEFDLRS